MSGKQGFKVLGQVCSGLWSVLRVGVGNSGWRLFWEIVAGLQVGWGGCALVHVLRPSLAWFLRLVKDLLVVHILNLPNLIIFPTLDINRVVNLLITRRFFQPPKHRTSKTASSKHPINHRMLLNLIDRPLLLFLFRKQLFGRESLPLSFLEPGTVKKVAVVCWDDLLLWLGWDVGRLGKALRWGKDGWLVRLIHLGDYAQGFRWGWARDLGWVNILGLDDLW